MAAIYDYATSPLFTPAERVALDFAMEAASVPNAVTDESYAALAEHWTESQIVELLGVVCMFGVFNRWNDSMATPLEEVPLARPRSSWVTGAGRPGSTPPEAEGYSTPGTIRMSRRAPSPSAASASAYAGLSCAARAASTDGNSISTVRVSSPSS